MRYSAVDYSHQQLALRLQPGCRCIDATAGRGYDTAFLCSLAGEGGEVTAFDVQQEALDSTAKRLEQLGYHARLILDSHHRMEAYFPPESVDAITFNFGWLPGGDHAIFTKPDTSIPAIQAGLRLLRPGGVMSLCIYSGKDTGYGERDALLKFLPTLPQEKYTVLITQFSNRPNDPPIPVLILKE